MTASDQQHVGARVAVLGGGLAGMAAAAGLCRQGFRVELFEARPRLGGRAGSFRDVASGELVDHCQHVAMGCCTSLADFLRRTGTADCFRRQRRLCFIAPDGRRYGFSGAPLLPAPLHLVPGLIRLGYLRLGQRLRILRTMNRLARAASSDDDEEGGATIGSWLRDQGESSRAIERFWSVVLLSTLSETLDRASLTAARKVFVDGFLASRRAYELQLPRVPLAEIFDRRVGEWLTEQAVGVHRSTRVARIEGDADRAHTVVLPDGSRRPFDFFVVAVPWRTVRALFSEAMLEGLPGLRDVERIESAPITAVHLWFDRPITGEPNAALVGRLGQWLFRCAREGGGAQGPEGGHHYQVVISASHELIGREQQGVVAQVREELAAIWPAARGARLLRWRVLTNPQAVFSVRPGIGRFRPPQETPIRNLVLAGDWTATGWPATMEGAVRSGYLAAEAVLNQKHPGEDPRRLLAPELRRGRLARWMIAADAEG